MLDKSVLLPSLSPTWVIVTSPHFCERGQSVFREHSLIQSETVLLKFEGIYHSFVGNVQSVQILKVRQGGELCRVFKKLHWQTKYSWYWKWMDGFTKFDTPPKKHTENPLVVGQLLPATQLLSQWAMDVLLVTVKALPEASHHCVVGIQAKQSNGKAVPWCPLTLRVIPHFCRVTPSTIAASSPCCCISF